MYLEDITTLLEEKTTIPVIPFLVDEYVDLPAVTYKTISFSRNANSSLSGRELTDHHLQITILDRTASGVMYLGAQLVKDLEGFAGTVGETTFFITRVINEVDLFFEQQRTYEKSLDVIFTIKGAI